MTVESPGVVWYVTNTMSPTESWALASGHRIVHASQRESFMRRCPSRWMWCREGVAGASNRAHLGRALAGCAGSVGTGASASESFDALTDADRICGATPSVSARRKAATAMHLLARGTCQK